MYADRHARSGGLNPAGLGLAVVINVAGVAALLLASPTITKILVDPPLRIVDVPPEPVPEPQPQPKIEDTRPAPREHIETVTPIITPDKPATDAVFPILPPPLPPGLAGGSGGTGTLVEPVKPPLAILVQPGIDPRYAADFQPLYPAAEQRMGRDGRVIVRVLVGVDGRVKQIEPVSATSDAFLRSTIDRAKAKWRFTPGTRDGIPVEAWRTMTLTFVMRD